VVADLIGLLLLDEVPGAGDDDDVLQQRHVGLEAIRNISGHQNYTIQCSGIQVRII